MFVATGNHYDVPDDVQECLQQVIANDPGDEAAVRACVGPDKNYVDAIAAVDIDTGKIRWGSSMLPYDGFTIACVFMPEVFGANCPSPAGPDHDFGQAPMLFRGATGRRPVDLVGAGQKSGVFTALHRDTGEVAWSTKVGPGGHIGAMWGSASDGTRLYGLRASEPPYTTPLATLTAVERAPVAVVHGGAGKAPAAEQGPGLHRAIGLGHACLPLAIPPLEAPWNAPRTRMTGLADGALVRVDGAGRATTVARTGGRPLGLARLSDGRVLVCDAERGLLVVDLAGGSLDVLVAAARGVLHLCNSAAVARDGTIFFSDSSQQVDMAHFRGDLLAHRGSGRLLRRDPDGTVTELLRGLYFANGVALAPDESRVYVAESGNYGVCALTLSGPKAGQVGTLIDGLGGFPDNLSSHPDGSPAHALSPTRRHERRRRPWAGCVRWPPARSAGAFLLGALRRQGSKHSVLPFRARPQRLKVRPSNPAGEPAGRSPLRATHPKPSPGSDPVRFGNLQVPPTGGKPLGQREPTRATSAKLHATLPKIAPPNALVPQNSRGSVLEQTSHASPRKSRSESV